MFLWIDCVYIHIQRKLKMEDEEKTMEPVSSRPSMLKKKGEFSNIKEMVEDDNDLINTPKNKPYTFRITSLSKDRSNMSYMTAHTEPSTRRLTSTGTSAGLELQEDWTKTKKLVLRQLPYDEVTHV